MKFLKKALPHLVALLVFAAISAMFFSPQYSDKALNQGDMVQHKGMGQDIVEHEREYGEHPQWAGRMFGGMPAYHVNMNYEGRWIKDIADYSYFMGQPAAFLFIAMATFYLMLLMFGVNPWLSMVGGIAYGLSTYFPIIIEAGHITKMMALAWIPAVIGSVYYAYRRSWLLGSALAGVFLAIEISTTHNQITYYFAFVVLALFINELVRACKKKILKKFALTSAALIVAAGLAVGANAVQLYYVESYATETIRGKSELKSAENDSDKTSGLDKSYATQWSYGKAESFNMFIPNFAGGSRDFKLDGQVAETFKKYELPAEAAPSLGSYFGPQPFTSGPVYIGAVMVFLFVFGMFYLEGRKKWWVAAVSALALMLAWGHNFNWLTDLFLDYFPLYNKFRTVSMILVILEWSIPFLAIMGLWKLVQDKNTDRFDKKRFDKSLIYSVAITGGFALIAAVILPSTMNFAGANDAGSVISMFRYGLGIDFNPERVEHAAIIKEFMFSMEQERASLLRADAFRSLLFVLLTAAAVWGYSVYKSKEGSKAGKMTIALAAVMALLTTVDLYAVDRRFVKEEDFVPKRAALQIEATEADKQILQDKGDYRVANLTVSTFQDASTSYFHRSVGGYHAAKLRRYQDLIDNHLQKVDKDGKVERNMNVYNMLNTKYFITPSGVQVNDSVCGSAWPIKGIKWVDSPDEEIAALGEADFDPRIVAVVDKKFAQEVESKYPVIPDSTTTLQLVDYKVNHITYKSSSPENYIAVFSEIYYPKGWKVYVDGREENYFRANYVLRAMVIPGGNYTIEWKFAAPHFNAMVTTTKASSVLLILLAIAGGVLTFRKKKEE